MRGLSRFTVSLLLLSLLAIASSAQTDVEHAQPGVAAASPAIVIGFVGGYVSHTNMIHAEVHLASRLRDEYSPRSVHVRAFENHRGNAARAVLLKLLDTNHDGSLSAAEKQNARIIFYGHSWGASESVYMARELAKDGIPVLLTIQVDSVTKNYRNDSLIPANVKQAVNFYQPRGLVRGESKIHAADPARTQILGNFRIDYASHPISCSSYPWWDRFLVKSHTEIECDPNVWQQVETLIRANLPPPDAFAKNLPK
ncbi:MAG TPA: hypothetical protein VG322_11520 [Candidatus Acidoferrales bacterium]|jgi:hypothetical protein|nr:hypothetical protein [Candidatus Acidoferrales bacterium]